MKSSAKRVHAPCSGDCPECRRRRGYAEKAALEALAIREAEKARSWAAPTGKVEQGMLFRLAGRGER